MIELRLDERLALKAMTKLAQVLRTDARADRLDGDLARQLRMLTAKDLAHAAAPDALADAITPDDRLSRHQLSSVCKADCEDRL
jgi:hypothetical protein